MRRTTVNWAEASGSHSPACAMTERRTSRSLAWPKCMARHRKGLLARLLGHSGQALENAGGHV
ncbi:hypothetical protein ACFWUW_32570 [Streptomyces sp. NPDC058655]|uniref:hypothetical protein n=1 Tax=Streptomyces sp. NPDC058655 TaxID=3346577 RepID=UPI00364F171B